MQELAIGGNAPDFSLPDQSGRLHRLSDYAGKWVLVYFYPKDDTPGCTIEACALRDGMPDFRLLDAEVLGISADSADSHMAFSQKHALNFTLLSDYEHQAAKSYGVYGRGWLGGLPRSSFLIDPQGRLAKVYHQVEPSAHAREVLADIRSFSKV